MIKFINNTYIFIWAVVVVLDWGAAVALEISIMARSDNCPYVVVMLFTLSNTSVYQGTEEQVKEDTIKLRLINK